jgi:DNA-binding response OmpR family regulator
MATFLNQDGAVRPIKVLVIEDHPTARELFKVLLEAESYEVLEAASGREGLQMATSGKPDLIILDLMIPELDGYGVIAEMRRDESLKETPILVVSAKTDALDSVREVVGVDNVFAKPFEPTHLLDRVGSLVGHPDD